MLQTFRATRPTTLRVHPNSDVYGKLVEHGQMIQTRQAPYFSPLGTIIELRDGNFYYVQIEDFERLELDGSWKAAEVKR